MATKRRYSFTLLKDELVDMVCDGQPLSPFLMHQLPDVLTPHHFTVQHAKDIREMLLGAGRAEATVEIPDRAMSAQSGL